MRLWLRFFGYKTAYAAASPAPPRHQGISLPAYAGLSRSHDRGQVGSRCNRAKSAYSTYFNKFDSMEIYLDERSGYSRHF